MTLFILNPPIASGSRAPFPMSLCPAPLIVMLFFSMKIELLMMSAVNVYVLLSRLVICVPGGVIEPSALTWMPVSCALANRILGVKYNVVAKSSRMSRTLMFFLFIFAFP